MPKIGKDLPFDPKRESPLLHGGS